ncbi:hypothetical protein [Prevotella veroralis]|nr:hypothetical protein [Prevotella veroralis]
MRREASFDAKKRPLQIEKGVSLVVALLSIAYEVVPRYTGTVICFYVP